MPHDAVVARPLKRSVGPLPEDDEVTMILELVFLIAFTTSDVGYAPDEVCPVAVYNVHQLSPTQYAYGVSYTMPAEGHHPARYIWRASGGKIVGSRKSRQIIVDTSSVKAETVTVTLKIHWKNLAFMCCGFISREIH